ncbi:MAG: RNA 2',3'-cyclic phosphodiesterase [Eggerthellaceae bacterium]|nr:RNA 2',3'-cyclic phosphodiesterase [Eggerthellaceae bacterium]
MRAFIALELPEEFADQTAQLARALQPHVQGRFMKRDTYHLTLAFLGEIGEAEVTSAMVALDAIASCPAVPLRVKGLGTFKARKDKTLYLAMEKSPQSQQLANMLRDELSARNVSFDGKKFLPHVTLARRSKMADAILDGLPFPTPTTATCVTLFKSTLSPEGATYKPLYSVELAG